MSVLLADIDATCAALGVSDGKRYQAEPDAAEGLKHLIWILRRDLDNHEYRRHLGRAKVLQTDLVYMLPDYVQHEELSDLLIRLLVILTNPTLLLYRDGPPNDNHGRKVFLELIDILQGYKAAFAKDKIWTALFEKLKQALEIVTQDPVVALCGHMFCALCIGKWMRSQGAGVKCPYCQSIIGDNTLITINATDVPGNSNCQSIAEHRLHLNSIESHVVPPEESMFVGGVLRRPPELMPRIKPLAPELLVEHSNAPSRIYFFDSPILQRCFVLVIVFYLFVVTLRMDGSM
ncbi:hypothetical protein ACLKA7_009608 [Drosophila subpalustris]